MDENEAMLTGLYGEPIEVKEHEKVYQVDATHYVTLLTSRANTYQTENGEEKEIDLSLVDIDAGEEKVYGPKDSGLLVELPANTTGDTGIKVGSGEHTLELFPEEDYGNATVQDNALLYNHVRENVDIQYTVDTEGLKEDIILEERQEDSVFRYAFDGAGYDVTEEDNQILVRENGKEEVLFVLAAPVMTDASGEESQDIRLSLKKKGDQCTVILEADKEWLDSPDRTYPVKIDPTVTVPTASLVEVTTSTVHGTYHGTGYGYAGYITGEMTKVPGARDIGRSRMYFAINYNFADNIPKEARIDSATLNVYEYVKYPQTNATFACYRVKSPWSAGSLTWDTSVGLSLEPSGAHSTSGAKVGMHKFDIRESVNNWVQGLSPNYGLVVMATNEANYGGAFYTPYSTGTAGQTDFTWDKRPSITINWSVPDPVDLNYGINNTSVTLRTMILTDRSGKLQFQGVFADGVAAPGSTVAYSLNDTTKNYAGLSYASYSYKYPNSSSFDSVFPAGTTKYKDKLGNWQTAYPFTEAEFNVLYNIKAAATKKGTTGKTNQSEDFTVYKVTQFDTLPKIAAYYGVPLSQIMYDNRVQDMLLVENNTLFIRNPKKNATIPYNPPALTNADKAAVDSALMGRGLHCEFGFEPVNLNTGNFYLDRTDVGIPDYTSDFAITRSYNSKGAALNSAFGRGWAFEYSEQISQDEEGNLYYIRDDGSILMFTKDGERYTAPDGYDLTLERKEIQKKTYDFGKGKEEYPVYEYTITDAQQTVKTFNYFGMLTAIEDEKGNRTTLSYDANQKLTQIKSPAGSRYGLTIDEQGHITEIALPNGSKLLYGYDAEGNLVSYTDACGAVTRYEYDKAHRMTAWYDGNGTQIIGNEYDEEGRVIRQTDANGGVSTLAYEEGRTTATDAEGHVTIYHYDDQYRTTKVDNPDGTTRTMKYNKENRLVAETDEMGHTTKHEYDETGNEIRETRFDGKTRSWQYDSENHVTAETGYDGIRTQYRYDEAGNVEEVQVDGKIQASLQSDAQGRILAVTDAEGNSTEFSYSGANLTSITDADGGKTTLSYNAHGQVTKVTDPLGGTETTAYDGEGRVTKETTPGGTSTKYVYDSAGNAIQITDGNGNTISATYDGLGNQLTVENGSGGVYTYVYDKTGHLIQSTDAEDRTKTYAYDVRGNLVSEKEETGAEKHYTYDALGNPLTETDAKGAVTTYTYDYTQGEIAAITDSEGNTTTCRYTEGGLLSTVDYPEGTRESYTYDALKRVVSYTDEGGLTTTYSYDRNGNVLREDVEGLVTYYTYNELNQLISEKRPDGETITYAYDGRGNLSQVTDAAGNTMSYRMDGDGKLLSATDALKRTTKLSYDKNGNISEITDAAGNKSRITYGAQSQPAQETDPLGSITSYSYNQMEQVLSVTDAAGGRTSYTYNKKGLPDSYTDANGNRYQITYDANGNYDTIFSPDGTQTHYTYDSLGRVKKEENSSGLVTEYEYDSRGRIIRTWDNEGMEEHREYDAYGNVTGVTNALGEHTEYVYDKYQRLTKVTEADGAVTRYRYDVMGNLTEVVDAEGKKTTYVYDASGNVTEKTDESGRTWTYEYDAAGQLIRETNPKKETTKYRYDVLGNVVEITDAEGSTESCGFNALSLPVVETDKNGGQTVYTYDALGRVTKTVTAEGGEEVYTYDANGNETSYTDAEGNTTKRAYDELNRIVKETLPNGGEYTYAYDENGSMSEKTDPLGNKTTYENNLHGQATKRTLPNGAEYSYSYDKLERITGINGPQGLSRSYTYDISGNLVKETDQSGREVDYQYDIMGRITGITNPLGYKTSYTYDEHGNLSSEITPKGNVSTYRYDELDRLEEKLDPAGRKENYIYDKAGNLVSTVVNEERTTSYTYDGNGNLLTEENPLGEVRTYTYDQMNRLTKETDAAGETTSYTYDKTGLLTTITGAEGGTTRLAYDGNGNLTALTDGEGRSVRYAYDEADRLIEAAAGNGEVQSRNTYAYDSVGNLTSITDGNGNTTTYTYDLSGNTTSRTNALGETERYEYDLNNRLSEVTRPDGDTITYDYNKLDALLATDYSDEADGQVLYAYDPDGRRVSMSDLTGTSSYTYDEAGRITGVQQGDGSVILYEYDCYGNLSSLTYPDGSKVRYEYDALDRLTKVTDREGGITEYEYDASGNMIHVARANGTESELTYDGEHQVTEVRNLDQKGKEISVYCYTYDLSGFILAEKIQKEEEIRIQSYSYNSAGQLTDVLVTDEDGGFLEEETYAYDQAGNRIRVVRNAETLQEAMTTTNTYDAVNRLIKKEDSTGGASEYLYDANGNQIRVIGADEKEMTYTYDTENRLIAVRDDKGLLMAALYDGDDNRMFTANRTEDTKEYQLFKRSPKTSTQGEEASLFWYGFGQSFIQAFTVAKDTMGEVWRDIWEELASAYHRKIAKDRADDEGIVVNPDGLTNMPGDGDVTYPSETGQALIPYKVVEETYDYYEVRNYVNDINQEYTQVLSSYDEKGRTREVYTYGNERLNYSDGQNPYTYTYTGTGSVDSLTDNVGQTVTSYRYDAYGNVSTSGMLDTGNPYTYNGEYTDKVTGYQYLRARYYNPGTGVFQTQDSYEGNLLEPLGRNLYSYVENNPVNFNDPSGHRALRTAMKKLGISGKGSSKSSTVTRKAGKAKTTSSSKSSKTSSVGKGTKAVAAAKSKLSQIVNKAYIASVQSQVQTTYERYKRTGSEQDRQAYLKAQSRYVSLMSSKLRATMKHFCGTAKKVQKDSPWQAVKGFWNKYIYGEKEIVVDEELSSPDTGFYIKTKNSVVNLSDTYTGQFIIKTSTVDNKGNVSIGYSINLPSFDLGNGKSIGIPIHLGGTVGTNGFKLDASIGIDLIAFKGDIRASTGGGKDNPILGLGTSLGWLNEKGGFGVELPSMMSDSFKMYYFGESTNGNKIDYNEKGVQLEAEKACELSSAAIMGILIYKNIPVQKNPVPVPI